MPLSRIVTSGSFAVVSGLLLACGGAPPAPPPPPAVTVATVVEREITEWDEFTGRLQAVDVVEVRPRVSGYVQRVAFAEGREVAKGDVLFEIDPRPYEAEQARAEAELEQARTRASLAVKDVRRAERLIAVQAISREELDGRTSGQAENEAAVRAAEAAVATARLNLEWTRVRSPIAGRVSRAAVTEGNLVQAGSTGAAPLTTVVSIDPIYVYFDSDEQTYLKYASRARTRIPARLGLANEEGYPHQGHVDFIDNQLDPATGTIRGRAVFSNKSGAFTPGLFARVRLEGSARYRARLIQDRAVGTDQDRKFVLVLEADGTVDRRDIELGRQVEGLRVVRSGLQSGDQIVINGLQRVRPGMKVVATAKPMVADSAVVAVAD